jgi:hypothetical protein
MAKPSSREQGRRRIPAHQAESAMNLDLEIAMVFGSVELVWRFGVWKRYMDPERFVFFNETARPPT